MAAKPPKPSTDNIFDNDQQSSSFNTPSQSASPSSSESENYNLIASISGNTQSQRKENNNTIAECSCTNISIMQLFHEMKQEFPTVPDHIVNQCVIDNCHHRETCIKNLKRELASLPNPIQSYPAQLRNNQNTNFNSMCNNKLVLKPVRPAPVPNINITKTINHNINLPQSKNHLNCLKNFKQQHSVCNLQEDYQMNENKYEQQTNLLPKSQPLRRPTTLSFRQPVSSCHIGRFTNQSKQNIIHKPVRRAPLPPTYKSQPQQSQLSPQPSVVNYLNKNDQAFSSTSVQSPLSFSDSGESEISVNISLSPSSEVSHTNPLTRRTSSITVQPEPPYTRDFTLQNPRSFTSLNLTLRKPSGIPQSPIDITAGPGLTYSSSSFDARHGYQKSFHITVTDQGGTFSASRIRPRTIYSTPAIESNHEISDAKLSQQSHCAEIDDNVLIANTPYFVNNYCIYRRQQDIISNIIQRQRSRKDALSRCLQKNKQKLERVQSEIRILTSPVTSGESKRLDSKIEKLRCDCQNVLQEIENTKRIEPALGEMNEQQELQYSQLYNVPYHLYHSSSMYYQTSTSPDNLSTMSAAAMPQQSMATAVMLNQQQINDETITDGDPPWTCGMCTFQNHPLLNKCECCDNIRQMSGIDRNIAIIDNNVLPISEQCENLPQAAVLNLSNNNSIPNILTNIQNNNDIAAHFVYLPFDCDQNHDEIDNNGNSPNNYTNNRPHANNNNNNNNSDNNSKTKKLSEPQLIS